MSRVEHKKQDEHLSRQLSTGGFRFTPQRQHVYDVLIEERDHPTAEEVFIRAKHQMPEISMATVYNCLDALVSCGMARQVNVDRGATRFCPNMREHGHFHCDSCGSVLDVDLPEELCCLTLPAGFSVGHYEIAIHGLCADCAQKK